MSSPSHVPRYNHNHKNTMKKLSALVSTFTLLGAAASAQTVVTFDGYSGFTTDLSYTESGFNFSASNNQQLRFGFGAYDASSYLAEVGGSGGSMAITNVSGADFSFVSADVGNANTVSETITFTGYLSGTEVASAEYTIPANANDSWVAETLPGSFADVDSITMDYSNSGYLVGMDNVTFGAASPAPEPTTLTLGALGLGGLIAARRRK